MKRCETLGDLQKEYAHVHSGCAADTIFMARASMYSCELLTEIARHFKKNGRPRRLTKWQKFFSKEIRKGKSAKQIGYEWRNRKARK